MLMSDTHNTSKDYSYIGENIRAIRDKIADARLTSPSDDEVTLLLATKYASAEEINAAADYGIRDIGENRVQQLLEKYDALDRDRLNIHFIGQLQKNKVKYIVDKVCMIHSLDSVELAAEIDRRCEKIDKVMDVLIEINIGEEDAKGGISPSELDSFWEKISAFSHIRVVGIMTMAPKCEKKEDFTKYFRETYSIFLDFSRKNLHNISRTVLSMGMSDSYTMAVSEGANLVRVGRAAFVDPSATV